MARKGNQQKNGLDRHFSNHKKGVSESRSALPNGKVRGQVREAKSVAGEELSNGNQPSIPLTESVDLTNHIGDEKKNKLKSDKFLRKENQEMDAKHGLEHPVSSSSNSRDCVQNPSTIEASGSSSREENGPSLNGNHSSKYSKSSWDHLPNGLHTEDDATENLMFSDTVVVRRLRASALSILKATTELVERLKPREHNASYINGLVGFILSIIAMIGVTKFLIVLAIAALLGLFVGFAIAVLLIGTSGIVFLWFYGSFWTTALVIVSGGLAFMLSHERLALFITTVYSIYCAWTYVGWLGLLLGLNLSFISSDALIFFLKSNINEHRRRNNPPETAGMQGRPGFFYGEPASSAETGSGQTAERSSGVPSTSGNDSEITSEDEVVRLLNCTDHYSALGLSRYENVDVSILKREYRKKAMLVHPDKNMGNEKAAEAFKKLQNAYEVLLDSFKRKAYDDELRREELLNCFRRFQSTSQKNGGHGIFASGFTRTEADGEDPLGESRRIACRKCGNFHIWVQTKKLKSQARWCQECKDFHQAKDGDGWVEQSSQPFFFGILQKVDAPSAYVCADSKIYDATEWYICQGMACPVNSHKPSFHVNTSVTSKHNNGKGTSSGQRGGIPTSNVEESMTEEEFYEWLQNAVQAGVFDNFAGGTSSESPSARASKSSGSNSGSGSGSKRKKKGKKQW
ncbi:hypothetical protein F0562_005896 [Nyssa sinensis]|uniref:J domain-containing protein n=1 Tax=Nyssa sinensis TaxID=561372 RepID=A0A5J5AKL6_9ASTE|nr:hypothetical protein F0562_005896 [Nyssa sinensis]